MTSVRRALVVMSLIATTAVAAPAGAGPDAHDVTGDWDGFFLQDQDSGGSASLDVFSQTGRRFTAVAELGEDLSCPVNGTISESLQMSGTGKCSSASSGPQPGGDFTFTVTVIPPCAPCVLQGAWILSNPGGRKQGDWVLLRDQDGPKHLVDGTWDGAAFDEDGNRVAEITAEFDTGTEGKVPCCWLKLAAQDDQATANLYQVLLDLTHPPDPDSPSGFAAVGGGEDGLLLVTGRFTPGTVDAPQTIEGALTLVPPSASVSGTGGADQVLINGTISDDG